MEGVRPKRARINHWASLAKTQRVAKARQRAKTTGSYPWPPCPPTCCGVGQILGPVVTARLLESSGSFAPGLLGAAVALIGASVLLVPLGKVRF